MRPRATLGAYFVADVDWHDEEKYAQYVETFSAVLKKYGGRTLATDHEPRTVEGNWKLHTLVILEFKDMEALNTWYGSPEYAPLQSLREAGAVTNVVTVRGVPAPSG
ncbi:MAG: DUF1330 domain-containing protein [Thermoplasmata archaeon]